VEIDTILTNLQHLITPQARQSCHVRHNSLIPISYYSILTSYASSKPCLRTIYFRYSSIFHFCLSFHLGHTVTEKEILISSFSSSNDKRRFSSDIIKAIQICVPDLRVYISHLFTDPSVQTVFCFFYFY
jgi:hypothetical protein